MRDWLISLSDAFHWILKPTTWQCFVFSHNNFLVFLVFLVFCFISLDYCYCTLLRVCAFGSMSACGSVVICIFLKWRFVSGSKNACGFQTYTLTRHDRTCVIQSDLNNYDILHVYFDIGRWYFNQHDVSWFHRNPAFLIEIELLENSQAGWVPGKRMWFRYMGVSFRQNMCNFK